MALMTPCGNLVDECVSRFDGPRIASGKLFGVLLFA
jgi:hypothetical protein